MNGNHPRSDLASIGRWIQWTMCKSLLATLLFLLASSTLFARVVVFSQPGFPTVASQPVDHAALAEALKGMDPVFVDLAALKVPSTLSNAELLILPYGSAAPVDAWKAIEQYLHGGGNLLSLGGQPLRVPVTEVDGKFVEGRPQDTYSRVLDFRHTYEVPVAKGAQFAWKFGYVFGHTPTIRAKRFFTVEGRLDGLGYMLDSSGLLVAAPVIVADHTSGPMTGSRLVALDFDPEIGYWQSEDGIALIHQAADYARRGATDFSVDTLFSTLRPGEPPQITVHLHDLRQERLASTKHGEVKLELRFEKEVIDSATLTVANTGMLSVDAPFHKPLSPGFYTVSGAYSEEGHFREFYQNGFWVEDKNALTSGPTLGVHGDFLTRDNIPFFPVGTNYFTTEENGWDFSSPRNAWIWEKDFDEMSHHGVSFVRTGVWMPNGRFIEGNTGGANERFLRNLEAFLLCAHRHHIAVNFTFFAFSPHSGSPCEPCRRSNTAGMAWPASRSDSCRCFFFRRSSNSAVHFWR